MISKVKALSAQLRRVGQHPAIAIPAAFIAWRVTSGVMFDHLTKQTDKLDPKKRWVQQLARDAVAELQELRKQVELFEGRVPFHAHTLEREIRMALDNVARDPMLFGTEYRQKVSMNLTQYAMFGDQSEREAEGRDAS